MRAIDFNKIDLVMKEKSLKKKSLLEKLGLKSSAYASWRIGKSRIQDKYYQPIADFLGVPLEEILGDDDDPMLNPFFFNKGIINDGNNNNNMNHSHGDPFIKKVKQTILDPNLTDEEKIKFLKILVQD